MGESFKLICASLLLDTRQVGTKQRHVIVICVFPNVSQSIRVIKAVFYCSSTHNLEVSERGGPGSERCGLEGRGSGGSLGALEPR